MKPTRPVTLAELMAAYDRNTNLRHRFARSRVAELLRALLKRPPRPESEPAAANTETAEVRG